MTLIKYIHVLLLAISLVPGAVFGKDPSKVVVNAFFCWPAHSSAGGTLNRIVRDT